MATIRLESVEKTYGHGPFAVRALDLSVADGEFLTLVGPSGSGKSTLLRLVAGLETATRGRIWIGDREVTSLPPQERDVAMVFQSYALYPHMTVRQNLEFGLRVRGMARSEIDRRVERGARQLGLDTLLDRRPAQLSGGQRQRVALGRAIVRDPRAFLFDEPLSNLDATLRLQTRAELGRLQRRLGATSLYVTHDQEEAMTLGDRVAVLRDGALQQIAAPVDLYRRPANRFVAGFIGSPAMNLLRGGWDPTAPGTRFQAPGMTLDLPLSDQVRPGAVWLGVRPHDVDLVDPARGDARARVDLVEPLGRETLVHVSLPAADPGWLRLVVPVDHPVRVGDQVGLYLRRDRLHLFDVDTDHRLG